MMVAWRAGAFAVTLLAVAIAASCVQIRSNTIDQHAAAKSADEAGNTFDSASAEMVRVIGDRIQTAHVEGLPFGTRGGAVVEYRFPADGNYDIKVFVVPLRNAGDIIRPFGDVRGEQLEVLLDGERVKLFDWDEAFTAMDTNRERLRTLDVRVPVTAGTHTVGVTFLARNLAPSLDLNEAFDADTTVADGLPGYSFYPLIDSLRIDGPTLCQPRQASRSSSGFRLFAITSASWS